MGESKVESPRADSGNMPGYFGILNADGVFWSLSVHKSEREARDYIRRFWAGNAAQADWCLRRFKIVPVRVILELIPKRAFP